MRRARALGVISLWLASAAMGCDSEDLAERLEITVLATEPVVLDSRCALDCSNNQLLLEIEYPDEYIADETIELEQYRVDYDLAGIRRVPYFAAPVDLELAPGDLQPLVVRLLGRAQQQAIVEAVGSGTVAGTATVRIVGYGYDDSTIDLEQVVEVVVGAAEGEAQGVDGGDER